MIKISGEYDEGDDEYGADYDPNDADAENDSEISNDNDQNYDSDIATESGGEDNPDYGNKEEIEDEGVERHIGEEQNESQENLSGKEENIEEIMEENSEPETNQQEERVADSDSEIHEHKPEMTSSVETENIGTEQSTITLQQQSQEQIPEHEPEDNEDIIELIDSEGEALKPIQNENEEINKIIFDAEKMEWKKMEFLGEHASSHEEMEVEMLEEEMEELFNKYVEMGLEQLETSYELNQENHQEQQELEERLEEAYTQEQESETSYELKQENHQEQQELEEKLEETYTQEQELETSHELKQGNHQEQQELEERLEEAYTQEQEEKITLEIERAQEQDEKENIKESSHTKIKENMQELSQELEQSNRKSQEIEQKIMEEVHQNIVQEEIQEQVEKQKELALKKSDKLFKERYREETGGRPIYAGKETKGFIEWKDHLKEQGEMQEENDNLFREKKKETKEHSKVIRESKEEWAQYLENSIKEAEFSEEIKTELNEILEKYEQLRELLKNLKNKEISEEKFEKEVKEFEYLLIEKRYITRPLFMNFDWFRRYYNGRIKKAGKMVAHLYISKKTREFLSYISGRIEQLNNIGHSQENVEEFREFLEKSFQINEKWALLLNNLIHETPNEESSKEVKEELEVVIKTYCEIRAILLNKNILEVDKDKLIQERIEKSNPRFFELFEILKRFLRTYDNYSRKWMEQSLIFEGKKTIRQLSQKIKSIKEEAIQEILNGDNSMLHKFKEILRVNLYKSTELNMNEKSKIIKIIQNENFNEENKVKLTNILSKLSIEELISLLGEDFKQYSQPYVKKENPSINGLVQTYASKLKKIIPKLARKLDLRSAYAPTLKQLKSEGYKRFINKIITISKQKYGFNYFCVVAACGLRIKKKWDLYDFDDLAQRLLYDIGTLSEFNDSNHPKYMYLPQGFAPHHSSISWLSYVFPKRPYSYRELCSKYGLKLISGRDEFTDRKNYTMDDWFTEYKECRCILIERKLQNFESDEGPNTEDFSKKCNFCNTFYVATRRAGLNVFEIGIKLGFFPRNPKRNYKKYTLRDYVKLLKEELESGLGKELGLYEDEAPRLNSLKRKRSWMWAAILRSDFLYNDIVRTANLKLYLDDVGLRGIIGNYIHEITGSKIIGYTRNLGILSFKEVCPSKIDNLNVIDILLIRYDKANNFINKIEIKQNIIFFPNDIKLISIDITISRDIGYIIEKFYKGYQGAGKFLIIVVFENYFTNIRIPLDVKFRNNIKIISVDDFTKFISLDNKEIHEDFKSLIKLVESINKFDDEHFRILEDLYRKAKRRLKLLEMYNIRHKDLEIILKRDKLYDLLRMPK